MTLAECLGAKAGEGIWADLINQMTHFLPVRRGTAAGILEKLSEAPKKYFGTIPGKDPKGPSSEERVRRSRRGNLAKKSQYDYPQPHSKR